MKHEIPPNIYPVEPIIESTFIETSRNGKHALRSVQLALTEKVLLITESGELHSEKEKHGRFPAVYFIDSLKLSLFKKSQRQTLKILFNNESTKYFDLDINCRKKMLLWTMWCKKVVQLQKGTPSLKLETNPCREISFDLNIFHQKWRPQTFMWTDKYLYLGSRREIEDQSRPSPVPGLGLEQNMKLLYLKPQYFGCWDQSEHWVQCEIR